MVTDAMTIEISNRRDLQGAGLLAVVADPIRWRLLALLTAGGSCVCNLQEQVPIAANLLSYHLKVLREAGLVTTSRRGRWIDYALAPTALDRLHSALPGAGGASSAVP